MLILKKGSTVQICLEQKSIHKHRLSLRPTQQSYCSIIGNLWHWLLPLLRNVSLLGEGYYYLMLL